MDLYRDIERKSEITYNNIGNNLIALYDMHDHWDYSTFFK